MKNLSQTNYGSALQSVRNLKEKYGETWNAVHPESAARMIAQNRFKTGLDIAKYTAGIMRKDMAAYDKDSSKIHAITWLLARVCGATKHDCCQKTPQNNEQTLFISFRLDGCCITL